MIEREEREIYRQQTTTTTMKNKPLERRQHATPTTTLTLLITYLIFGTLHELAHLGVALWLLPPSSSIIQEEEEAFFTLDNIPKLMLRILFGRCVTVPLSSLSSSSADYDTMTTAATLIRHSGWVFSVAIAILCHLLHKQCCCRLLISPNVVLVAYITALEAMTTDLFGFVPHHHHSLWYNNNTANEEYQSSSQYYYLTFFCGNFGILLLNPSWLSIDGGRTALDVLEKMVSLESLFFSSLISCHVISSLFCIETYANTLCLLPYFMLYRSTLP